MSVPVTSLCPCSKGISSYNDDARVSAYLVEAENFESIHNHSA